MRNMNSTAMFSSSQFGTPQQGQAAPQQFQFSQSQAAQPPHQPMFSSSVSQSNLFASSYSPQTGQQQQQQPAPAPNGMSFGQPQQAMYSSPQNTSFGMSQAGPGVGAYQPSPAGGPRYLPGYLMKHASTPNRSQNSAFGNSLHQTASAEDMANTSLDRDAHSSSPPHTRGSIFGSASKSRSSGVGGSSLFGKKSGQGGSSMDDDAPPIQSLDDMDELPAAASGSTSLVPSKFTSHSTSPNEQASALPVTTPPADAPKLIIFGFSRSALPQVIDHLSLIGPIVSVETPSNTNANYATITFQEFWQAARAIRRNGELVQNGTIMIGIKWADPSRADVSQFSSAANNNGPMGSSATPVGQFGQARPSNPKSPFNPLPNSSAITTPSTPQQPNAAPAVGSPVPILGSNYKATDLQHSGSRWSISGMLGNSAAPQTHGDAANANTAANNPFVPQQQQQQSQQAPGVWSKVSDAIFGF